MTEVETDFIDKVLMEPLQGDLAQICLKKNFQGSSLAPEISVGALDWSLGPDVSEKANLQAR